MLQLPSDSRLKWIVRPNPGPYKIGDVARHDRQIVHQRDRRDLLIDLMRGVGHAKPAPNLRGIRVERQDLRPVLFQNAAQPRFEARRMIPVTAILPAP